MPISVQPTSSTSSTVAAPGASTGQAGSPDGGSRFTDVLADAGVGGSAQGAAPRVISAAQRTPTVAGEVIRVKAPAVGEKKAVTAGLPKDLVRTETMLPKDVPAAVALPVVNPLLGLLEPMPTTNNAFTTAQALPTGVTSGLEQKTASVTAREATTLGSAVLTTAPRLQTPAAYAAGAGVQQTYMPPALGLVAGDGPALEHAPAPGPGLEKSAEGPAVSLPLSVDTAAPSQTVVPEASPTLPATPGSAEQAQTASATPVKVMPPIGAGAASGAGNTAPRTSVKPAASVSLAERDGVGAVEQTMPREKANMFAPSASTPSAGASDGSVATPLGSNHGNSFALPGDPKPVASAQAVVGTAESLIAPSANADLRQANIAASVAAAIDPANLPSVVAALPQANVAETAAKVSATELDRAAVGVGVRVPQDANKPVGALKVSTASVGQMRVARGSESVVAQAPDSPTGTAPGVKASAGTSRRSGHEPAEIAFRDAHKLEVDSSTGSAGATEGSANSSSVANSSQPAPNASAAAPAADAGTLAGAVAASQPLQMANPSVVAAASQQDGRPAQPETLVSGAVASDDVHALPSINTARVIQSMQGSEMRVGMHSVEFGQVSVSTSMDRQSIAAQISFEHMDLGKALTAHLPAMEAKLSTDYGLHAKVEVREQSMGAAGGEGGRGESRRGESDGGGGETAASTTKLGSLAGRSSQNPGGHGISESLEWIGNGSKAGAAVNEGLRLDIRV